MAIAQAFTACDTAAMEAGVAQRTKDFEEDGNAELIALLMDAVKTRKVQQLTKTYLTLVRSCVASDSIAEGSAGEANTA